MMTDEEFESRNPRIVGASLNPKDSTARAHGRTQLGLLSPTFKEAVARVMEYGAYEAPRGDGTKGYGPYNWRDQPVALSTYLDATERHIEAIRRGEWIDPGSGRPHAAHIGANANVIVDADHFGTLVDDLKSKDPKPSKAPSETESFLPSRICPMTGERCYVWPQCSNGCALASRK